MMYAIQAQILTCTSDGYEGSRSVPTFYLDSDVQGLTGAGHAAEVAADVINALHVIPPGNLRVTACPAGEPASGEFGIDGRPIPRSAFAGNVGHVCAPRCERHTRRAGGARL
jgi:hypothetical protein